MSKKTVFKKNPNLVTRKIDKETILVPVLKKSGDINCIYTLNKAASAVWDMIDGKRTTEAIKKTVLRKFDTDPTTAGKKLEKLFKDMRKIKAVL